jgi:hypothetical protein
MDGERAVAECVLAGFIFAPYDVEGIVCIMDATGAIFASVCEGQRGGLLVRGVFSHCQVDKRVIAAALKHQWNAHFNHGEWR